MLLCACAILLGAIAEGLAAPTPALMACFNVSKHRLHACGDPNKRLPNEGRLKKSMPFSRATELKLNATTVAE
jgi:hypothetical protein